MFRHSPGRREKAFVLDPAKIGTLEQLGWKKLYSDDVATLLEKP